ncbi:alkaline phosphatase family protein [Vreelandella sp. EE22]
MNEANKILLLGVDGLIPELVERFCDEGVLPNIERLRNEGGSTRLLPYISTWGDTNFVALLTGQAPGTSWVGQRQPPTGTRHLLELMQGADKRAALVHFPESVVPADERDLCLAPFWSAKGPAPMELAPACLHMTQPESLDSPAPTETLGWPPTGTLAHHQKHNRYPIARTRDGFTAHIPAHRDEPIAVKMTFEGERLRLQAAQSEVDLGVGEWSEWLPLQGEFALEGKPAAVRFKLLSMDAATGHIDLLQSQVTAPESSSGRPGVARRLIERHGPFISKWAVSADPDTPYFDTSFEEGRYQLEWLIDSALTLLHEEDFSLFATVFRLNDETHHTSLAQCDPESAFYQRDDHERYLDVIRHSYRLLDDGVGRALAGCDTNTTFVLASDHGDVPNSHFCDIHRRLAEFDLCTVGTDGRPAPSQSQAFLKDERGGLEIFVNRERVPENDIERVKTRILKALTTWYVDTESGERNVVALAVKREDAAPLGYWGDAMGDVLFAYAPGFVWGSNTHGDTVAPVTSPGANHGPQIPTARTAFASNLGVAFFQGAGIRHADRLSTPTLPRMDSMGATFARLLGLSTDSLDSKVVEEVIK